MAFKPNPVVIVGGVAAVALLMSGKKKKNGSGPMARPKDYDRCETLEGIWHQKDPNNPNALPMTHSAVAMALEFMKGKIRSSGGNITQDELVVHAANALVPECSWDAMDWTARQKDVWQSLPTIAAQALNEVDAEEIKG